MSITGSSSGTDAEPPSCDLGIAEVLQIGGWRRVLQRT
jgi:hypothetical protein